MQLHKDYANKGLVCMSLTVDKPKDHDRALTFLKDHDADFANYRIDPDDNNLFAEKWKTDEPPRIRVYDRDGKLKGVYSDYKEVIPIVKELVAATASE